MNPRVRMILGAACSALVLALLAAVLFQSYRSTRHREFSAGLDDKSTEVEVLALLREVDIAKGEVRLRLFVNRPADDPPDQAFELETNSETANPVIKLAAGTSSMATDATVSFEGGDDLMYPFDRYTTSLDVRAFPIDNGGRGEAVPVALSIESLNAGFQFEATGATESAPLERVVGIELTRSAVPKVMAVVMSVVMAALAVIVVSVGHLIVTGRRKFEFASFTWMAAMLFALVGFRNAAPGTPPMGSLFDFMGFFWAELAVAGSLIRIGAFYIRRQPNPPSGQTA